jgi:murein DD-endopeptidase MepM/ murein hydrolase activator NlpD
VARSSRPADDRAEAARQLEAFFLRRLLAEARPAGGDPLVGGGFAGETFKEMLDEQLADKMSQAGGVGLAQIVGEQMGADPSELAAPRIGKPMTLDELARRSAPAPATMQGLGQAEARGPRPEALSSDFAMPAVGRLSSPFGMRKHPIHGDMRLHAGLDVAAPTGTPVAAAAAGEVVHAGPSGGYGNLIKIRHADGTETRYAHLSRIDVTKGQTVPIGHPIGAVGSTGASTGPHLHFEIRKDGKPIDPRPLLPLNDSGDRSNR